MKRFITVGAVVAMVAGQALAQPVITSLGSGTPNSLGQNGSTLYVGGSGLGGGGASRWTLSGGSLSGASATGTSGGGFISADGAFSTAVVLNNTARVFGNTATGVTPTFSTTPTLVASTTDPASTEFGAGRWSFGGGSLQRLGGLPIVPELMVYGSGSSGSSTGSFMTPHFISSTGRFVVGQAYISSYSNSSGNTISASTFNWRPFVWDAQGAGGAGSFTVLPTPMRTSSNTWRRRTGTAYAVSSDGTVIVGAQEHNVSAAGAVDPDGGRLVVWRWDGSAYTMSYLPNGVDAGGFPITYSTTAGTVLMNSAGTIIVARAADASGMYLGRWTWNSATSSWSSPENLGSNLTTPASWLPGSVTSCAIPPNLTPTGMSEDGQTIVGTAVYSTCGSFMSGGFIKVFDGPIQDWYDYLVAASTPGITENYGPIGDNGDPARGLPRLGYPTAISQDGNAVAGLQGGTLRIPGATPWLVQMTGGTACVAPTITQQPSNASFSRCSVGSTLNFVSLSAFASGTAPFTYQWFKDGVAINDGTTASGSSVTGATTFQMRINKPMPADAGAYTCVITGCNGQTATTVAATVAPDAAMPTPANDTCQTAQDIGEGTANFNVCGAYVDDGFAACSNQEAADVWFRYTPTFTGPARFQTCGSTFDTTVQVYSDCNGSLLACNNDVGQRGLVGVSCNSNRSVVDHSVTAGQAVLVRVGALGTPFTNSGTSGALTIGAAPVAPPNDQCEGALPIAMGTHSTPSAYFNLGEATEDMQIGVDVCGGGSASTSTRDVYFRLSAGCGGTYTIDTCGSTMTNPMLHVFSGCSGILLACHDNVGSGVSGCTSNQARIADLVVGGDVIIRVSSSGASAPNSGAFQLNITGTPTACCGPQDFNGDGDSGTDQDIEAFFACLGGTCCQACWPAGADFNGDGDTGTDQDIEAFFRVLGGGTC
ncbi:MAG TPA: immunoglobulin domain-containing protein [Phycisphaerales bacterium]|nr:immunoglobulin domain-containing protein [Phycisphaerales bacterium]